MSKEVIDKKVEELAKQVAAAGPQEKKQDVKTYYRRDARILADNELPGGDDLKLVAKTDYNLLAGENKALKYELNKLATLLDKKNAEIDQLCDETKTVPVSLFDETKARLEMCRKKLKKLGSWQGE